MKGVFPQESIGTPQVPASTQITEDQAGSLRLQSLENVRKAAQRIIDLKELQDTQFNPPGYAVWEVAYQALKCALHPDNFKDLSPQTSTPQATGLTGSSNDEQLPVEGSNV